MNWRIEVFAHQLQFIEPGGTSRGVMHQRPVWYVCLSQESDTAICGIGECAPLFGLSAESKIQVLESLVAIQQNPNRYVADLSLLSAVPSVRFALEMALLDYERGGLLDWYDTHYTSGQEGIRINGLIWMGDEVTMQHRIDQKLAQGFSCLKLKIGSIDFEQELQLLRAIRRRYAPSDLELRVDANGAFLPSQVGEKLQKLSNLSIHSIEQPIAPHQIEEMRELCLHTPIPIALDEELIGKNDTVQMAELLNTVKPQYIILKPSLLGGFMQSREWIALAEENGVGWWVTSALESNIGLDALAQFTSTYTLSLPQGLGTGQVFSNNVPSNMDLRGEMLFHPSKSAAEIELHAQRIKSQIRQMRKYDIV